MPYVNVLAYEPCPDRQQVIRQSLRRLGEPYFYCLAATEEEFKEKSTWCFFHLVLLSSDLPITKYQNSIALVQQTMTHAPVVVLYDNSQSAAPTNFSYPSINSLSLQALQQVPCLLYILIAANSLVAGRALQKQIQKNSQLLHYQKLRLQLAN